MIIKDKDLYTQSENIVLISTGVTIGRSIIQYEVQKYVDTRNLAEVQSFVVTCTQRVILPNADAFQPVGGEVTSFSSYPALFTNRIAIADPDSVIRSATLIDYSPKTMNTSVTTSQNDSDSSSVSNSQQYSSGSSTAQTNTFGASVSLGFFGDSATGDIGGSASHSSTSEKSRGSSSGRSTDSGSQYSNASSMALKDWGAYAQLDSTATIPTWIYGQEYPWNVIQFRNEDSSNDIVLPDYVQARLFDGVQVYPPSELSLFGVDFVSKAAWLITPKPGLAQGIDIGFSHALTLCVATHSAADSVLTASIDTYEPCDYSSPTFDLPVMALDPIGVGTGAGLIGFVANQFDVAPTSSGGAFAITADTNLMLIRGTGFNGVTSTDFSAGDVALTIYFKMLDTTRDVNLSLKHWVTTGGSCQMTITINGTPLPVRTITAPEGGMGADNVLVVPLRAKDFTSVDYCDFLQFGLNTITVTITSPATGTTYTLLAAAVG
ncbi:hypothetical protein [Caulobacter sp. NIBR1757]|uniref:hypothetical protein n=1 Tax=Caulobacter sp. NIBR1757 TaxID=3016000 RepID=UPI0022F0C57D|nr:hypothetical protein [Caulobacter sp. NIBR1757]WGM37712.1 hypothetical protein AMEJIAPC_00612 [Caulobacter sp. NIBR1757]